MYWIISSTSVAAWHRLERVIAGVPLHLKTDWICSSNPKAASHATTSPFQQRIKARGSGPWFTSQYPNDPTKWILSFSSFIWNWGMWSTHGQCNVNKTVNSIKCCSQSIGTCEGVNGYTWVVLHLHSASCKGSAETFRRTRWQDCVLQSLCQRLDFDQFCWLCAHSVLQ